MSDVKEIPRSGRIAGLLLGAMLVAATTLAGAAAAAAAPGQQRAAVPAGQHPGAVSAGHGTAAGVLAPPPCGGPGAFPVPRAPMARAKMASDRPFRPCPRPARRRAKPRYQQPAQRVFCASASDCWAAGTYVASSGGQRYQLNQALRWDGSAWTAG